MIVSTSLMRRRDDLDRAAFEQHWLDPHGALAARLPGCTHYVQNHILDVDGTNALARRLQIDGIPQLAFATPENRFAAHGSDELKACDRDSELFVGAVSRVITEIDGAAEFGEPADAIKQILLFVSSRTAADRPVDGSIVDRLAGVRRSVMHRVMQQTHAPGSKVANLDISVGGLGEVWLESMDAVRRNADLLDRSGVASFVVKVYRFI